jgi:hypothetical protein
MKARNVQFGERKNPDSSRVHGLRLAVCSLPVESVRKLESANGAELTPPPAPYEAGWPQLPHSGLPNEATGGTETGRDRLLTVEEVAVLLHVPVSWVYGRTRKRSLGRLPATDSGNTGASVKTKCWRGLYLMVGVAMPLDMRARLETDTRKGGRVNGKETMARRRYQDGCLFIRGRVGRKVWVARWREDVIRPDGAIARIMRSQVLGSVSSIPTRREARKLLSSLLRPTNFGLRKPQSTVTFGEFTRKREEAVLPTYRVSTRNFYKDILRKHLAPKFASYRLCDIHTPDVQIFLNQKTERYSSSVLHHIRATLSRTFACAKEWGYVELNPVLGVRLPPKKNVRPKTTFEPSWITKILDVVKEPPTEACASPCSQLSGVA